MRHTCSVTGGQRVGVGPAVASVGDWEPGSLRAGPVERGPDAAGLTHSYTGVEWSGVAGGEAGGVETQQLKHAGISRSDFI